MRLAVRCFVATLVALGSASQACAGPSLGVAVDANLNRTDAALSHATMGTGVGIRVPVRIGFGDVAALRIAPGVRLASGSDRVVWTEDDNRVYADVSQTTFVVGDLMLGPELTPGAGALRPYLGADVGVIWAWNFHVFEGVASSALLPDGGGSASSLNPYARQLAPAAGLHGGFRWKAADRVAIELEAGYNVSFLPEAELRSAPSELDAARAAYGWNTIRVGLGATFLLGNGTNR